MVVLLPCSIVTFVDCVHFCDFTIDEMPLEICTYTRIINRWTFTRIYKHLGYPSTGRIKTCFKMGRRTKKFGSPGLQYCELRSRRLFSTFDWQWISPLSCGLVSEEHVVFIRP